MSCKTTNIIISFMIVFIIVPLTACSKTETSLEPVTLQINWYHAPEFVGFYMASAQGFYKESGIDARILEGGPGIQARDYILDGRADFSMASFDEQKKFIQESKPSVAVMSVFQIPPLVLFSLKEAGIKEPRDLIGKKVGIKNDYWENIVHETLVNTGVDPSRIIEVKVPVDAQSMLYDHEVDVWMGYAHDEPILARQAGYNVTNIYPADYGVGGYEGLLLVNRSLIEKNSDLVERFVQASQKGLKYALEHPDEAASEMVKRQAKHNLEFYKMAIRALIPLVDIPQSKVGWIDSKKWEQLMGNSFDSQNPGFTMQFLQNG